MSNKLLDKFKDRKPAELTAEETYEIIDDGANLKEEALRLLLNK